MKRSPRIELSGALCAALGPAALAGAGTIAVATGADPSADGYLSISLDDYGAWASTTFGGGGDLFNPAGTLALQEAAFTSGFFLFLPDLGQRELLADNGDWQNVLPDDATLSRTVISPSVASDSNGDGVNDFLQSSFRVTGGTTNLAFSLAQHVRQYAAGTSFLVQTYVITNDGSDPVTLDMVRVFDGDLLWSGNFENDEVGTGMHGAGLGKYVFEQEAANPGATAITLSGTGAGSYFGAKHGLTPGGGPPAYDYGTDTEVWDALGIPGTWQDHIAGVGYGANGVSGTAPAGSTPPEDGFVGLDFRREGLPPGGRATVRVLHTYGRNTPVPCAPVVLGSAPAAPLPDNDPAGVSDTIVVGPSFSVADLEVRVAVNHTWLGDLCVTLSKDGGPPVLLMSRINADVGGNVCHSGSPFGCSQDNMNVTLDDDAPLSIEDQCAPGLTGAFQPAPGALAAFTGVDSAGAWTLNVSDNAAGDLGTLVNWSITLDSGLCACPWDLDGNGVVDTVDFLGLLALWGPCPPPCPADFDGNGFVDTVDFLALLARWGPCP